MERREHTKHFVMAEAGFPDGLNDEIWSQVERVVAERVLKTAARAERAQEEVGVNGLVENSEGPLWGNW